MFPSSDTLYPLVAKMDRVCFLKNVITNPNIIVGDYTYYDDEVDVKNFEKNILYHYEFLNDKLIIGKFCQIASNVRFLMNGMFHAMNGFTTYPFMIFSEECRGRYPEDVKYPFKGDTIIENDVWIGYNATFMPGVKVSNGAIIGTNALVTKDVGPYEIWGGNPAKLIRKRFSDEVIADLQQIQWWNWDIAKIVENVDVILSSDIERLKIISASMVELGYSKDRRECRCHSKR